MDEEPYRLQQFTAIKN